MTAAYEPPLCTCGDPIGVHEVRGHGLDRRHGRCSAGRGPSGEPCGCRAYEPQAKAGGRS